MMGLMPMSSYCTVTSMGSPENCSIISFLELGSDTIPPVFTQVPRDTSVNCSSDLSELLSNWYIRQAGAEADNGSATIFSTVSLAQAQDSLTELLATLCKPDDALTLSFFALDSCGNRSLETLEAKFIIFDLIPPNISIPAQDKEVFCNEFTVDSLQQWIDTQGGALATESCGTFTWTNYVWSDDVNNSGFQSFQDSTDIRIRRANCSWSVEVTFFLEDGCGNDNFTAATFNVIADTIGPHIVKALVDTILLCDQAIPNDQPVIWDGCDGRLSLSQSDSLVRSNSSECDQFEYQLIRTWTTQDACGNVLVDSRNFFIVDTLPPTLTLDQTIAIDCNLPPEEYDRFIETDDNCGSVDVNFRDSITFNSLCQNQFIRTWIVTDPCGNKDSLNQTIQVQDFSGPEFINPPIDVRIECNQTIIEEEFMDWITEHLGRGAIDNCNAVILKALPADNYTDTVIINATPEVRFEDLSCGQSDSIGLLNKIAVTFIAYDICGNITREDASFSIVDNEAPVIQNCPTDFDLQVGSGLCAAEYLLLLPAFSDNCLATDEANWTIDVDGNIFSNIDPQGLQISLGIGNHIISYQLTDCGNNTAACVQEINVFDNTAPELSCVDSLILYVTESECEIEIDLPQLTGFTDNCFGASAYNRTMPDPEGFLSFSFSISDNAYKAMDFFINFEDITNQGILFRPYIRIEYSLNLNVGSTINIRDEQGRSFFTITDGNCQPQSVLKEINETDFFNWSQDDMITFLITNEDGSGTGTQPCAPSDISGTQGKDNESYLRVTLDYADIKPDKNLEDLATGISQAVTESASLMPGNYALEYAASDAVDNIATCVTAITILDTISPALRCDTIRYEIDPLLQGFFPITEAQLNYRALDNCGIDDLEFSPRQVACDDSELSYMISVMDPYGNESICSGIVIVSKEALNPSFLSGLCLADSLKFQSNLPEFSGFQFAWSGPDNFSSNESNPIITGINDEASGIYTLIATTPDGCEFLGELLIDVQQFDSPEIFSNELIICQGEELLLNTDSFNEIVEYFWYEGISPNGTLISQTDGPSLSVMPTTGDHFYYVEVKGNNCNSNPSNTLEILVTAPPFADITDPFITQCVGENIVLMTDVFGQNFEYEWSGPNNYNSVGQFPEVISNITESAEGTYTLIIKDGSCVSDTASAQVIVFPKPPLPIITGDNIFCEGQSAVLTVPNVPNGTSFQWFNNDLFYRTVSTNSLLIPSISTDESGEWKVIAEEGICTSDTSNLFLINVESSLNIGATNNGPLCEGDSVSLTTSFIPNATYQWQDPSGETYNGRIVTALSQAGVYTVTVTTESNCVSTTTTTVQVGIRPQITALSNTSLPCMSGNTPVTFKSTVFPPDNYTYSWTGPNGFTSNLEEPIIQNFDESNNGEYVLVIIKDNCASEPLSNTINITLLPEQPEIEAFTSPCFGDDVDIIVSNPSGIPGTSWIWQTPMGQVITDDPILTISDFNSTLSGSYSAIQAINGCRSEASANLSITLQTEPLTPSVIGNSSVCQGENYLLSVDISNADSYIWFTPNGTVTTVENNLSIENVDSNNQGFYSVFIKNGNCISDTSQIFSLTVLPLPETFDFMDEVINICKDNTNQIEICTEQFSSPVDIIKLIEIETNTTIQESENNCFELTFLLDGPSGSYELGVISSLAGCDSEIGDSVIINLSEIPSGKAEINLDTIFICGVDFASITVDQSPDDIQIRWSSNDPDINIFDATSKTVSLSNLRNGPNSVFLTSSSGSCKNYDFDTVILFVLDEIRAEDDILTLDFGLQIPISVLDNDNYLQDININLISNPEVGTVEIQDNTIAYNPQPGVVGDDSFEYEICYEDCPELCDQAVVTLSIGQNVDCFVGNMITPNADGYNDVLKIPCLDTGNFELNSLIIFNEWGDEVYSAAPYKNDWAGEYNGKLLPVGTYYYILELGDGSPALQGFLILEL